MSNVKSVLKLFKSVLKPFKSVLKPFKVYLMAIFRVEAQRLKKEGVEILIALGHAGYREVDLQMAGEVIVACPTQLI